MIYRWPFFDSICQHENFYLTDFYIYADNLRNYDIFSFLIQVFMDFFLCRLKNSFICSLPNTSCSPSSLCIDPYSFNSNISFSYILICRYSLAIKNSSHGFNYTIGGTFFYCPFFTGPVQLCFQKGVKFLNPKKYARLIQLPLLFKLATHFLWIVFNSIP